MKDIETGVPLHDLDPETYAPGYWARFQSRVLEAAHPELARRALTSPLTLGDVLLGWGRLVLPATLAAAAIASLVVLRAPLLVDEVVEIAGLEELLALPHDGGEPLPYFLHQEGGVDRDMVLLAMEEF